MKNLLITRPREDANLMAEILSARGFCCICEPMLAIEPVDGATLPPLDRPPQAILCTSRHAVPGLANLTSRRDLPLLTVGGATRALATQLGYTDVTDAGGTAEALIVAARERFKPQRGPLLYLRGDHISTDIAGMLECSGFTVESLILYHAQAVSRFSGDVIQRLREGAIDAVLFFSARSAAIYVELATLHGLQEAHASVSALCMSHEIAAHAAAIRWRQVQVAPKPKKEAMIALAEAM